VELNPNGVRLAKAYQGRAEVMPVGPVYLAIETTSHCNLECVMCPQPRMARAKSHMAEALFRRIVDQAAGKVAFAWLHLFGEPLANPRFVEMAAHASRFLRTGASTNVTLLRGKKAEEMAALPLDILLLSMDGITAPSYQRVRVRGDFAQVVDNVRAFAALWLARPPEARPRNVVVSFIDLPMLSDEVEEAEAFWRGIVGPAFILNRKPFHPWASQDALVEDLLRAVGGAQERVERRRGCHEFFRGLTVLSDGTCVACCNDYEGRMRLGNLAEQTLDEVWNGAPLRRLRRDRMLDNPLCRHCTMYEVEPEHALLPVSPFQPWHEMIGYTLTSPKGVSNNLET